MQFIIDLPIATLTRLLTASSNCTIPACSTTAASIHLINRTCPKSNSASTGGGASPNLKILPHPADMTNCRGYAPGRVSRANLHDTQFASQTHHSHTLFFLLLLSSSSFPLVPPSEYPCFSLSLRMLPPRSH
ncbi:hypothetical protein ACSS6W_006268 [Trichoderma asperelloides]